MHDWSMPSVFLPAGYLSLSKSLQDASSYFSYRYLFVSLVSIFIGTLPLAITDNRLTGYLPYYYGPEKQVKNQLQDLGRGPHIGFSMRSQIGRASCRERV